MRIRMVKIGGKDLFTPLWESSLITDNRVLHLRGCEESEVDPTKWSALEYVIGEYRTFLELRTIPIE